MNDWQTLDGQLKGLSDTAPYKVPVFGSSELNQATLATGLAEDLANVLGYAHLEWPSITEELNSPIPLPDRYNALLGYHALEELGKQPNPVLQRARVVTELYFDLIYFRDRILIPLRQIVLQKTERFGQLRYLSEWLEMVGDGQFATNIRALRNGFAHGKWSYLPDYSGLVFYPETKPPYTRHEITQEELQLMHALLYGFQIVFITVSREKLPK